MNLTLSFPILDECYGAVEVREFPHPNKRIVVSYPIFANNCRVNLTKHCRGRRKEADGVNK